MATLARTLSRSSRKVVDIEILKAILIFCGVGLFMALMFASYGVDLSPGFF